MLFLLLSALFTYIKMSQRDSQMAPVKQSPRCLIGLSQGGTKLGLSPGGTKLGLSPGDKNLGLSSGDKTLGLGQFGDSQSLGNLVENDELVDKRTQNASQFVSLQSSTNCNV